MKKILFILIGAALLLSFGCSRGLGGTTDHYEVTASSLQAAAFNNEPLASRARSVQFDGMGNETADSPAVPFGSGGESSEISGETDFERKLVKHASVRMRVENLEAADKAIDGLLNEYGGYSASTTIEENSHYYFLRVPSQFYDVFLSGMNGMGRMIRRTETTEDVTLRYYDLEGRLATQQELLRTFQSYLGRADSIDEILRVEAHISELQYNIEGTGVQLRNLINRIDYATIDLTLLGPVAAAQSRNETFGDRIRRLFGNFGDFLSTVAVGIVGFVIYGIPSIALLALLYLLLFGKIGLARKLWALVKK